MGTIDVNITIGASIANRASFSTFILLASVNSTGNRVRTYASLTEAETDGITQASLPWVHRLLTVAFSQPNVDEVRVGRRELPPSQIVQLTPSSTTEGLVYEFNIEGEDISYTVQNGDGILEIITGLQTAVDATSLPVTTSLEGTNTILQIATDDAGRIMSYNIPFSDFLGFRDVTVDPGVAQDIAAVRAEAPGEVYGLLLDSNSPAEVLAASAAAQTLDVLYVAEATEGRTVDPAVLDDLPGELNPLSRTHTVLIYSHQVVGEGLAVGALVSQFTRASPGNNVWDGAPIAGVAAYRLTTGQQNALRAKKTSYFVPSPDTGRLQGGYVSTLDAIFADLIRGISFLRANIQADFQDLYNTRQTKIPYTDTGVAILTAQLNDSLQRFGVETLLLASFEVFSTPVSDVPNSDRAARFYGGLSANAVEAGGIQDIRLDIFVSIVG